MNDKPVEYEKEIRDEVEELSRKEAEIERLLSMEKDANEVQISGNISDDKLK